MLDKSGTVCSSFKKKGLPSAKQDPDKNTLLVARGLIMPAGKEDVAWLTIRQVFIQSSPVCLSFSGQVHTVSLLRRSYDVDCFLILSHARLDLRQQYSTKLYSTERYWYERETFICGSCERVVLPPVEELVVQQQHWISFRCLVVPSSVGLKWLLWLLVSGFFSTLQNDFGSHGARCRVLR